MKLLGVCRYCNKLIFDNTDNWIMDCYRGYAHKVCDAVIANERGDESMGDQKKSVCEIPREDLEELLRLLIEIYNKKFSPVANVVQASYLDRLTIEINKIHRILKGHEHAGGRPLVKISS